jgi:hypothetical protein
MSEPKRYTPNEIAREIIKHFDLYGDAELSMADRQWLLANIAKAVETERLLPVADDPALLEQKRKAEERDALVKYELDLLCEERGGCVECNEHRAILMSANLLEAIEQAGK